MAGAVSALLNAGLGFTRTVAVITAPEQEGVIVKVTDWGEAVVLVKTPEMFPEPLDKPVTVPLFLVHVNVVDVTPLLVLKIIGLIEKPEQTVWALGVAVATGMGFTVTTTF